MSMDSNVEAVSKTSFLLTEGRLEELPELAVPAASGSVVVFWGRVRNHNEGRAVTGLEYSSYAELAEKEGRRIVAEAKIRFGLDTARAAHRVGTLSIGDAAVVVEVASGHRGEGFDACRWIIDEIKSRVPIWKREFYVGGGNEWVMCHHSNTTTVR
jgi:molybdopterin synthase catalytic subunit